MKVDPRMLDHVAEQMAEYAEWRTHQRIRASLGLGRAGDYAPTWIGALPVYLGSNKRWVPRSNWLMARPRFLHTPHVVPVRRETDRLQRVKPDLEIAHHNPAWHGVMEGMRK